ncbi:MAG: TIGR03087 family PEP-CTERM/XrtA system glycosyltransferase [Burkholderiaceae bacterium]|nr:TIGR03087 family PEP-CTERM/XrtA system glycosyltransferase [Burkholderiaceae bacterium]
MENLLLLTHRIPFPPNKGDKIRSYHLLKHLAQHYRVHLGTFVDDAEDWQYLPKVQALCASSHFARLSPPLARLRSLRALLLNRTLSLDYYNDGGLHAWVKETVKAQGIGRILVFSSAMAQYAEAYPDAQRVIDFVDVDSDKWRQYAEKKSWPMSWLYRHEARQLLRYERKVAAACGASLFVSQPEAALFRQLAPESAARIGHFNNGVDTEYFSPARDYENPYPAGQRAIVFTGAMDYWPNVDAVQWFAREVLPGVLALHPDTVFTIVGARPAPEVQQLQALPGVRVTGTVPDVRPYVAHAALAVAPLRVARGVQNKVLEAMAMGKTVIVSPQALEGIRAEAGRDLLLANDAAQFAAGIVQALAQPDAELGRRARDRVETLYGWASNLAQVETLLEGNSLSAMQAAENNTVQDAA